ncbi:MAG TPA: response regulator [Thermoanaerobaculia bacterium]|nr:response regulator [Thermoanaerobaculia bacterium]
MSHTTITGDHQRTILVIDDDLAIRVLLQAVLTRLKYAVVLAEDGAIALDKVRKTHFDLILLDLMMPNVDGYQFLEALRQEFPGGYPHVIVFTAAGPRGVEKIPEGAVCDSILKPFDLQKFIEMIGRCMTT